MHEVFESVPLSSVCLRLTDGAHFSPASQPRGHPIANVKDLDKDRVDLSTCTRISDRAFRQLRDSGCSVSRGDVLLSKDGTVGKVVVYEQPETIVALSSICILRCGPSLDRRFLGHALRSPGVRSQFAAAMSGSALRRLVLAAIAKVRVPLPLLAEQRSVADVLDTLDSAIRSSEELVAKLNKVKRGLLNELLTCGIDENGELRDPHGHPELFHETQRGRLPHGWSVRPIGELFEIQLGKMLDSSASSGGKQFPYLGNRSVQWERVDLTDLPTMHFSRSERAKFGLQPGDLLVCEGGEVGRTALWYGEISNCYYQKAVHRLRPLSGYRPELMLRMMRYGAMNGWFARLTSQSSIAHLTREKLATLAVPVPPKREQDRIVETFTAVDGRLESEEVKFNKLCLLRDGLGKDLLTGRIRVAPLPNRASA